MKPQNQIKNGNRANRFYNCPKSERRDRLALYDIFILHIASASSPKLRDFLSRHPVDKVSTKPASENETLVFYLDKEDHWMGD